MEKYYTKLLIIMHIRRGQVGQRSPIYLITYTQSALHKNMQKLDYLTYYYYVYVTCENPHVGSFRARNINNQ